MTERRREYEKIAVIHERLQSLFMPVPKLLPKPPTVQQAEEILCDWQNRNDKHAREQRREWRSKFRAAQDALVMGDVDEAFKLLQELEALAHDDNDHR